MRRACAALVLGAVAAAAAIGIATAGEASGGDGIQAVAAENVWGSIAAQVGGSRVHVSSVIDSPAADPHDYEPTAVDARAFADARLVIVDGAGYDPWASKLVAANPVNDRIVLDVGDLVGVQPGGNPHRWYSPADVRMVVGAIARAYGKLDPGHAGFYARRAASFERRGLARYHDLIATIRRRYAGVAVGASESIFAPLAQALRLRLVTPPSFLKAVSEGTEPTAGDISTIERQIRRRQLAVWVLNGQNSTPTVSRLTGAARAAGIPVVTITETLVPPSATFQAWQTRQLEALASALRRATRR